MTATDDDMAEGPSHWETQYQQIAAHARKLETRAREAEKREASAGRNVATLTEAASILRAKLDRAEDRAEAAEDDRDDAREQLAEMSRELERVRGADQPATDRHPRVKPEPPPAEFKVGDRVVDDEGDAGMIAFFNKYGGACVAYDDPELGCIANGPEWLRHEPKPTPIRDDMEPHR